MDATNAMKIAELARRSGVHRSTIHHYLNVGLLPRPRVAGPKLHWFGAEHIAALRDIQTLRERGWSLVRIRTHLSRVGAAKLERDARSRAKKTDGGIADRTTGGRGRAMQRRILEHATLLFTQRGYDGVRLSELARELRIGKATLYRHFLNKEALFIDCVERVRFTLIPKEAREALEGRYTLEEQGVMRASTVLQHIGAYRTMTHLLSNVAHGKDAALAEKAKKQLHAMVTNAEPLIRRAIREGKVRPLHPELLAYMLWGALIGAGERLALGGELNFERVLNEYVEFISFGLSQVAPDQRRKERTA